MNTRPKILAVDDNPGNLLSIRTILRGINAELHEVNNGFDALSMNLEEEFALILLDVQMPELDGFEVCEQLRSDSRTENIPIIFLTAAYKEDSDKIRGYLSGATDYLTKPIEDHILKAKVEIFLKLYNQQKQIQAKNKELKELLVTRDKFFSIIAHDLKSPFSGFIGLTKMMAEEDESNTITELRKNSQLLHNSALNLFKLLENLLEWSRLQNNSIEFHPKFYLLNDIIRSSVSAELSFSKNKNVEIINIIGSGNSLYVNVDMNMINTVLRNLISNAIKFTRAGGRIEITAVLEGKEIIISVKDSGIGMSEKLMEKLFKLDQKVSRPGTSGESSTGLGLMLCKEFIDKHGGRIYVMSEEGIGSTFYFSLPYIS